MVVALRKRFIKCTMANNRGARQPRVACVWREHLHGRRVRERDPPLQARDAVFVVRFIGMYLPPCGVHATLGKVRKTRETR